MKTLETYIKEGLLNSDISKVTAEGIIAEFWKLASDFGRGGSIRRDKESLERFVNLLPGLAVWAADNAVKLTDKNAWGIAIGEEQMAIIGDYNIYEFPIEGGKMKYSCSNADWYLGTPHVTSRDEVKKKFASTYEEQDCQVFWVDKKLVRLFK